MKQVTILLVVVLAGGYGAPAPAGRLPDTTLTFDVGAENFQERPQLAFDGTNYFSVWEDSRHDGTSLTAIYGARTAPDGRALDSVGIAISAVDDYAKHFPAVAFDGTNYLVVWQGYNPGSGNQDLYGARVSRAGAVLDPGGFLISSAAGHQFFGCVAFSGTNYLVAWWDGRTGQGWLYCARVTPAGEVLDPDGIPIMRRNNQNYPWGLSVAAGDGNWLVVADEENGQTIVSAFVVAAGIVDRVDTLANRSEDSRWFPDVDYDEADSVFLVAWQDWRSGAPPDGNGVWAARVGRKGNVIDPGGFPVADDPSRYQGQPAVSYNGRVFLIAYAEYLGSPTYYDICGRRVRPDGVVIDSLTPRHLSSCVWYEQFPAIVNSGFDWFVAWEDQRGSMDVAWGPDIYGSRVDSTATALDVYPSDLVVSAAAPRQFKASAAAHGNDIFVVWQEFRGTDGWDIYGARFDGRGSIIGDPIPIATGSGNVLDPSVAAGTSCYFVTWEDESRAQGWIRGRRVEFDGVMLDTALTVSDGYINRYPQVAFTNGRFMVVYWEGTFPYEARGRSVAPDGTMGDEFTIADIGYSGGPGWNLHTSLGLAYDGTNYLVVWPDWQTLESQYEVKGCRFTPAGEVLDPTGFFVTRTPGTDEDFPRLCFGGDRYFATWHQIDNDDVYGGRIDTAGHSLDTLGIPVSTTSGSEQNPHVAFDGFNYVVIWGDSRNDVSDIYAARVNGDGIVLDPNGIAIDAAAERQSYPCLLASDGTGTVAYSSFIDTVYSASRVQVRSFSSSGMSGGPGGLPGFANISRARPNPFVGRTALCYSLPRPNVVRLAVFDAAGRLVRVLENGERPAGDYSVVWDGRDSWGSRVDAGVYYCRLTAGEYSSASKMLKLD